ncbi:hypothetical protein [Microbacterium sp. 18062]|nr:hypothetical protein [Microbacterium sp. 18062]
MPICPGLVAADAVGRATAIVLGGLADGIHRVVLTGPPWGL